MLRIIDNLSRFTVGTVGLPGDRTFFLQIKSEKHLVSLSIEKSQVAALSERLSYMLKEIRLIHPLVQKPLLERDSLPLENPIMEEFRVGSIAIFYDENSEKIQVDLRELLLNENDDEDTETSADDREILRIYITASQARTFHDRAELVIAAGRQQCPFCGMPVNPDGHLCARANGYRR